MSFLLYGAGAVAVVAGIAMVGFGIPVGEFSFGNTLIISGTTAVVGGLIVIGLGAAVGHLQRISEALATRTPVRSSRPFDTFEPRSGAVPERIPFPPKPKAATGIREPLPAAPRMDIPAPVGVPFNDQPPQSSAPSLPNPDEPPVTVEDDVSLSPQHPAPASAQAAVDLDEAANRPPPFGADRTKPDDMRDEQPEFDTSWHAPPQAEPPPRPPHTTFFDTMWPAESKPAKSSAAHEEAPEPAFEPPMRETASAPAEPAEEPAPPAEDEPRAVAILKSGVVDGMGYTLYVDGSIEAELPHGTLRFASINELRSHLEKTS